MQLYSISNKDIINRGEYLMHVPTNQMVICSRILEENKMTVLEVFGGGARFRDEVGNFRKVKLNETERREGKAQTRGGCKPCGKRPNNTIAEMEG